MYLQNAVTFFCHSPGEQSLEALSVNEYKLSYYKNLVIVFVINPSCGLSEFERLHSEIDAIASNRVVPLRRSRMAISAVARSATVTHTYFQ